MMNWGNNAGKIRISLAAFALLAGSLSLSQVPGLAQKKGGDQQPVAAQPPQGETAKERANREEHEAANPRKTSAPTTTNNTIIRGNGAEEDGVIGAPTISGDPDPIVGGTGTKNAPQVIPDDGFITITGSTGQLDETGFALADFRNFEVGFKATPTRAVGSFMARYNITAVKDAFRTVGAARNQIQIKVRFRDSDGAGNGSRVVIMLYRAGIDTGSGGGEVLATFDSNTVPAPTTQVFQTVTANICPPNQAAKFDFGNYVYWVEANLTRTDPNTFANFGSLQLTETETACP